jgi:light-regulated signal transduction histidine kinase (bacteriophytochrome)
MKIRSINSKIYILLAWLFTIVIFAVDVVTPRGVTEGLLYIIVVMLTIRIPGKKSTFLAATAGIILTIVGFYFSPEGVANSTSFINRMLAVLGIIMTAYVVLKNKEKEETLLKKNIELGKLVSELQSSNSDLEQYAYIASHDLQEPLNNISNFLGLLKKRMSGDLNEENIKLMDVVLKSADKMQKLINDILLLSLIGRSRGNKKVDCNKILKEIIADLDSKVHELKLKITVGELPAVVGNETEITQLFQRLVNNAVKFRKKDAIPEIEIRCIEKNSEWEFSVRDNGIGIEQEYFNKIFLVFQRLHKQGEYPGTGIGLAACKKVVDLNGGRIWVSSSLGIGSTFHFTLPKVM